MLKETQNCQICWWWWRAYFPTRLLVFILKNKAESLVCACFCIRSLFGQEPFFIDKVASVTCCWVFKKRLHMFKKTAINSRAAKMNPPLAKQMSLRGPRSIEWRPSFRFFPDFLVLFSSSLFTDYTAKWYFLDLKLVPCLSVIIHNLDALTPAPTSIMLLF